MLPAGSIFTTFVISKLRNFIGIGMPAPDPVAIAKRLAHFDDAGLSFALLALINSAKASSSSSSELLDVSVEVSLSSTSIVFDMKRRNSSENSSIVCQIDEIFSEKR